MAALGMLLVLLSSSGVAVASFCYSAYTDYNMGSYYRLTYKLEVSDCGSKGCCQMGSYDNFRCCSDESWGEIVGITLGVFAGIALISAIFVAVCVYCTNASRRARTVMEGRIIDTPVAGRVLGTPMTRPQITCINTYNIQPGHTVQPCRNQGFASDAISA